MPRVSITVPEKTAQPYRFPLDREVVTIGRGANNDIVIDCPSVSSFHATMERVAGGYILRDRNSTNGIRLEEEDMSIIDLRNDTYVRVGDAKFDYHLAEEELDELDSETFVPQQKVLKKVIERDEPEPQPQTPSEPDTPKAGPQTPPPVRPAPLPVAPLATPETSFLYSVGLLICGALAFFGGLDASYRGKQSDNGRTGDYNLLQDIREGRPALPEAEEE